MSSDSQAWAGDLGKSWAEAADRQDAFLGPFGEAGIADLGAALGGFEGRRALDLGCGAGATSLAMARRGAEVTGVDISPDLIRRARDRAAAAEDVATKPVFVEADAGRTPPPGPFQALFSRFGCMFFDDPAAAYATLRGVMDPGAPLRLVAWRSLKENDWAGLPLRLAGDLTETPPRIPKGAPGPFAWADPETFAGPLKAAGWKDLAWTPWETAIPLRRAAEADPVADAVRFAMETGPLAARLRGAPEDLRDRAQARLREGFAEHLHDGAVHLKGAVWIISAVA